MHTIPKISLVSRSLQRSLPLLTKRQYVTWTSDFKDEIIMTKQSGVDLLHDPLLNKGTAFSKSERDRFYLRGLLPPASKNLELQMKRTRLAYEVLTDDIEKYLFLMQMQDRNETLFYSFVCKYLKEVAPVIYTPTVGRACQEYATIFRRPRGMYFSAEDVGEMSQMVYNYPSEEIDVVVVTDGGRILGLGDLGANGMGIPIGKLALYVAAGGINPGRVLPVMLDVGTNNEKLRKSPFYLGLDRPRMTGDEYFRVVKEFLAAVTHRWPNVLIQFEDFTPDKANPVLDMYRNKYLCFNDDIQGTGTTLVCGVLNALRVKGLKFEDICSQKIVVAGAGAAGVGVADSILNVMIRNGMTEEEALKNFYLCDVNGLIGSGRENPTPTQKRYSKVRTDLPDSIPLKEVIRRVKPDMLLGVSGVGGLFSKEILEELGRQKERPIIFPLSNPTSKSECTAQQAFEATGGRCIFASGSPFQDVDLGNGKLGVTSQANNMFSFPAIGLGCVVSGAKTVSDEMLFQASLALANSVSQKEIDEGRVYPVIENIRTVTNQVAAAIIRQAQKEGHCTNHKIDFNNLEGYISSRMWKPEYMPIVSIP